MLKFGPAAQVCVMLINAPLMQHMVISFLACITTQLKEKKV
jgi:hypothetical protein